MSLTRRPRGATLLELMIVMGLFGVLLYSVYLFIDRGITMYRESTDALEIRQQALLGMTRLSDEIRDTAMPSIHCWSTAPDVGDTVDGVVFASNKNADGDMEPDEDSGRIFWQKFVCYYLDPQADGSKVIHRREELFQQNTEPDRPGDNRILLTIPDPLGAQWFARRDVEYFMASTISRKLIARRVDALDIRKETDLIKVKMTYDLSGRYRHLVELQTKILPKL